MTIPSSVLRDLAPQSYQVVRDQVRSGDVLLCSARDPMSRVIRWATASPWSHVALAFRLHEVGRIIVLECVETLGVRAVPLSSFIARTSGGIEPYPGAILLARHDRLAGNAEQQPLKRMANFAFSRLGDRFSNAEILKIALRIALGRFPMKTPRSLGPADEFTCSEYVARCFEAVGIRVPWAGLGFVAPADIAADPGLRPIARIDTGDTARTG